MSVQSETAVVDERVRIDAYRLKEGKGGHIRIKVTEPCYIICICSITPRIDYGQGNTWDTYLETMDDWHKPALDGIGYQDSLNGERAWWADYFTTDPDLKRTSAGKTVAWINYMTTYIVTGKLRAWNE